MKTTFDLPDPLLRRAKAVAANEGRPLRDFVAEALTEKLEAHARSGRKAKSPSAEWKEFAARLQKRPDGSFINPSGIDNRALDDVLDTIRQERRGSPPENPLEDSAAFIDETGEADEGPKSFPNPARRGAD